nr:hypothetical protein [Anaerolineae bacterium]
MTAVTLNVTQQYDLPLITFDAEQNSVKVIQVVRWMLPDGNTWKTREYTFWETVPAPVTRPVYDEQGVQTGTEEVPNPDTWKLLPSAYALGARGLYDYLIGQVSPLEEAEILSMA